MGIVFTIVSKYIIVFLMALYTFSCYNVFLHKTENERKRIYFRQNLYMILIYSLSFCSLYIVKREIKYLLFYLCSLICIIFVIIFTKTIYKRSNRLIVNNMCMLLSIGFIIISRISFDKALRQYVIAMLALSISTCIPFIIAKGPFF